MSYTARDCCVCHCHYSSTISATLHQNATTTRKANALTPPRRWFNKIRRRPSIEQQEHRKREMLFQFHHLYHTVQEEVSDGYTHDVIQKLTYRCISYSMQLNLKDLFTMKVI